MSELTPQDVLRIAALARLELTPEETTLFADQLARVLTYAEEVQAVDTTGVPAMAHVHRAERRERDDGERASLTSADALAAAPDAAAGAGLFRVPRVID